MLATSRISKVAAALVTFALLSGCDTGPKNIFSGEDMLETPGTFFIAVGAGHLEGPDSVILMLLDKGYKVEGP